MNQCELSVYGGPLARVQAARAATQIVQYSPKKEVFKLQFEHDSTASHKKNDPAASDLLALWGQHFHEAGCLPLLRNH